MPAGRAHEFHKHPGCEEIIYIVEGREDVYSLLL